jgi:alkaline phosphatase
MRNETNKISTAFLLLTFACSFIGCGQESKKPKNIILLISDGCGYNQVDAASLYQYGETGRQIYEQFPVRLAMSTYPVDGVGYNPDSAWVSFKYVLRKPTDSAAAATAMSTGIKTYNKGIGVDTLGNPLKTAVEYFEAKGKSTGVVTSVPWTHATPASFAAHDLSRGNLNEIAREMVFRSRLDVIMGATHPFYNENGEKTEKPNFEQIGRQGIWDSLSSGQAGNDADGDGQIDYWYLAEDRQDFQNLKSGATPKRVIGIPKIESTLQVGRDFTSETGEPYSVPFIDTVPTLSEMALAALNVLDENQNGFFLMVEGGAIDWASHYNHLGRMIEEEIEFNKTIETICDWVESNSSWNETLVIVTGDHETGYLTGPGSNPDSGQKALSREEIWRPLVNNGKGELPGAQWHTHGHTNSLIPFYSKGIGCEIFFDYADKTDPVRGKYLDNTAIGKVLHSF